MEAYAHQTGHNWQLPGTHEYGEGEGGGGR